MNSKQAAAKNVESRTVNCLECRHYYITWDADFPHGCKGMQFKSRRLPQLEVLEASGRDCLMMVEKKRR
jgi:hypothetical protein